MSWTDDTGRHEGYVRFVFADGKLGGGTYSSRGLSVDGPEPHSNELDEHGEIVWRPEAAVVGWRLGCNHIPASVRDEDLPAYHKAPEQWASSTLWQRVYTPAEEDLSRHRICVPLDDESNVFVDDRDDVLDLLREEWRAHIEPEDHARSIRAALDALAAARQSLALEVAAARTSGLSWAEIGRVAGITRQAARDRWGSPS